LRRGKSPPAPIRATEPTIPRLSAKAEAIRRLNDQFRSTFIGGEIVLTDGFRDLPPEDQVSILSLVRTFNQFANDNDRMVSTISGRSNTPVSACILKSIIMTRILRAAAKTQPTRRKHAA
jgi:hypothetical protein